MKIHDISLPISPDLPVWPGDPPIALTRVERIADGALANVTRLEMGAHTGTHVDAPDHFLDDGRMVTGLDLAVLTGACLVLHLPDEVGLVTAGELARAGLPDGVQRLLLRTRNSQRWARGEPTFQTDFTAISADGAAWLVAHGIRLVGVDYLSVAPYAAPLDTHRILLQAGVVVVEGLDLSSVPGGQYDLYCLPLKLAGAEGAPARAILVE